MSDIVTIIPIHDFNDEIKGLLTKAVNSVPNDIEIRLSCKHGLSDKLKQFISEIDKHEGGIVLYEDENEESKSDFQTLVNQAVGDSTWFSILEFDDTYTEIWFDNVKKYIEYEPSVSVFMPLVDLIDYNNNQYVGVGNEAPWAASFSNEIGYIDNDCLESYMNFYMTGSIFNTSDWIEYGGLKPSMILTFWYEFLLRITKKEKKVFVIPKIGYQHYVNRKGSLFDSYKDMTDKEKEECLAAAKRGSKHKQDRKSK